MNNRRRHYYLNQLGIQPWVLKPGLEHKQQTTQLHAEIKACRQCLYHCAPEPDSYTRGSHDAVLLVVVDQVIDLIDEAHPAARIFANLLAAVNLDGRQIIATSLLKCSTDKKPLDASAIESCQTYLHQQITLIKPKGVLCMGEQAGQLNLGSDIPSLQCAHPQVLLNNSQLKKQAYQAWSQAAQLVD